MSGWALSEAARRQHLAHTALTRTKPRVLHDAVTVNIRGNSYRLKDKLKAGIVQAAEAVA